MDEIQPNEIREGTGCADVEKLKPPPPSPGRSDGSVSMETREEEERRWWRRFPEIKKCVILIEKLFKEEKDEVELRSGDPDVGYDWMEPLELNVIGRDRVQRFVKKVEVNSNARNRKPCGKGRGRGLLRCSTGEDAVQWAKGEVTMKKYKNRINQSETEHNTSSQSKDSRSSVTCGQKHGESKKKKLPKIIFRKVAGKQWVLWRSKFKKQQHEEEAVGGSVIVTKNKKRNKRQNPCQWCVACLRENCGECRFCLDKKQFGGVERLKQRCIHRMCLVNPRIKKLPRWAETAKTVEEVKVTMTTKPQQLKSRMLKCQKTEEKKNKEEVKWWRKKRLKQRGKRPRRESETERWTPPTEARCEEDGGLHPDGVLTGTHTQEGSVLHVSSGLACIPPPLHPFVPHPEEEVEVVMDSCRMIEDVTGWEQEGELLYTEVMWEQEQFYDIEVQLQEFGEEVLMSPCDGENTEGQIMTSDPKIEPPESISLCSNSFSLLGHDSSNDVACGLVWSQLLKALRTTVLPDHWVAVLVEGSELQLLQCLTLSSMTNTVVHIQSDLCFFITVQARRLPNTHVLYQTHKQTITHVHQLLSLLSHLEGLVVCQGSSPTCHLLLTPPHLTCCPVCFNEEGSTDKGPEVSPSLLSPLT